jgi:hypothetical protein
MVRWKDALRDLRQAREDHHAARFDVLPSAIQIPVREPEFR